MLFFIVSLFVVFFSSNLSSMDQMSNAGDCEKLFKKVIEGCLVSSVSQNPFTATRLTSNIINTTGQIGGFIVRKPAQKILDAGLTGLTIGVMAYGALHVSGLIISPNYVEKRLKKVNNAHRGHADSIRSVNSWLKKEIGNNATSYNSFLADNLDDLKKQIDATTAQANKMVARMGKCKTPVGIAALSEELAAIEKEMSWTEDINKAHSALLGNLPTKRAEVESLSARTITLETSSIALLAKAENLFANVQGTKDMSASSREQTKELAMLLAQARALFPSENEQSTSSSVSPNQPE